MSVHFGADHSTLDLDTESLVARHIARRRGARERRHRRAARRDRLVRERRVRHGTPQGAAARRRARIVTINALDRSACGGTHVRSTAEIGAMLIRRTERVRKTTRVEFVCGLRAVRAARADHELVSALAHSLGVAPVELVANTRGPARGAPRRAGRAPRGVGRARWLSRARALRRRRSQCQRAPSHRGTPRLRIHRGARSRSRRPSSRSAPRYSSARSPRHPRSSSRSADGRSMPAPLSRRCSLSRADAAAAMRASRRAPSPTQVHSTPPCNADSGEHGRPLARGRPPRIFDRLSQTQDSRSPCTCPPFASCPASPPPLFSSPPPRDSRPRAYARRCSDSPTAARARSATGKRSSRRFPTRRACARRCSCSPRTRTTSARHTTRPTRSGSSRSSRATGSTRTSRTFDVLFPTPIERAVELVAPTHFVAKLQEPAFPQDPTSNQRAEALPTYNAYSIDGDVTAPLVYVNYGIPADYDELARHDISVKGAIVIARYGGSWRGIKPKVAAEHGAVGCLIYSDPRDDGYAAGDRVPERADAPARWRAARQRRGHAALSRRSAHARRRRDEGCEAARRRRGEDASRRFRCCRSRTATRSRCSMRSAARSRPEAWRGALPITYHLGAGPAKVHLKVKSTGRSSRSTTSSRRSPAAPSPTSG